MSDTRVLANQKAILDRLGYLVDQTKLIANQRKLDALLAGQKAIKANQAKILAQSSQDPSRW